MSSDLSVSILFWSVIVGSLATTAFKGYKEIKEFFRRDVPALEVEHSRKKEAKAIAESNRRSDKDVDEMHKASVPASEHPGLRSQEDALVDNIQG